MIEDHDPVIAVAAGKGDSHKNVEMRAALQPLRDLAECHDSCVLGVTHFTKGTAGKDPRERVTASLAFGALARIVFATATRQGDGEGPPRLFTRAKNNLGPDGGGFGFEFNIGPLYDCPDIIVSRIKWLAPLNGTARDLLNEAEQAPNSDQRKKEKAAEIRAWLEAFVANGPRLKDEIEEVGVKLDYSVRQIRRARETLRLIVGSTGAFPRRTTWSLGAF